MVLEVMEGVVGVGDGIDEDGTERDGRTLSFLVLDSGVSMALLRMLQQVVHWRSPFTDVDMIGPGCAGASIYLRLTTVTTNIPTSIFRLKRSTVQLALVSRVRQCLSFVWNRSGHGD